MSGWRRVRMRVYSLNWTTPVLAAGVMPVLYSDQFSVSGGSPFQAVFAGRISVISCFCAFCILLYNIYFTELSSFCCSSVGQ